MVKQPLRTMMSDFIKSNMGSQFVIPVYQRNYTWNPGNETARFLDDLEDLLAGRTNNHFLGILIYVETEVASMFRQIQIVDGQQRLTTSFIFLLALKKAAADAGEKDIIGMIDDYFLYNRHYIEEARLRLKPAVAGDDVFARLYYNINVRLTKQEKEGSIYRNFDAIYQRIKQFSRKYSFLDIFGCLNKMDVLAFPLSDFDNAQQIFESINSTGAPLTSADLIRNYILMNDTNEVQEHYYRLYWHPLERVLQDSRTLEEFFRYFLASQTYDLLNRRDVYEGFKTYWHDDRSTQEKLQEIDRYCTYYTILYKGPADEDSVEEALADFRRSGVKTPAPFLMAMYALYDEGRVDAKTLGNIIRLIDSYLTRRALMGHDNGQLNRYFPQLLRSVKTGASGTKRNVYELTKVALINYNRGKALAMPTDEQLRAQLKEINAYSLLGIRTVLERIELYRTSAAVDMSVLNIEHIMPQSPNEYWRKATGLKDEDEYARYANMLGNLTLCAEYDNTRMGNQDFSFKKSILSKTMHIRMNNEVLNKDIWTQREIEERTDRMINEILRIYPYKAGQATIQEADNIIVLTSPSVNAKAVYHNASSIEILAGTKMKSYKPKEMKAMQQQYSDMLAMRILSEDEGGRIQFDKNYIFSDLNTAAQFLLHRGGDNTSAWTRENGTEFKPSSVKTGREPARKEEVKKEKPKTAKKKGKAEKKQAEPKKKAARKKPAKKTADKTVRSVETRKFTVTKQED